MAPVSDCQPWRGKGSVVKTCFHSNYSPEVVLGDKVGLLLFLWHPSLVFLLPGQAHLFPEVCEEDNLTAVLKLGIYTAECIL